MTYDRRVINYLKGGLLVVQLGVLVIIVLTGFQLKDVKTTRDFLEPLRNNADAIDKSGLYDIDLRFFSLLIAMISLTCHLLLLLPTLLSEKIFLFFITAFFTVTTIAMYTLHAAYIGKDVFFAESVSGAVLLLVSGILQDVIYKRIKKSRRLSSCV